MAQLLRVSACCQARLEFIEMSSLRHQILVEIPLEPLEPHTVFLPACTTIERCGGCCKNNLNFDRLKCVPDPKGITSIKKKVATIQ